MFQELVTTYGAEIISAIIAGIIGFFGITIKTLIKNFTDDKTKEKVAKTVVMAVEQLYKDVNGDTKFQEALKNLVDMLAEKNITITDLEAQLLIEAAVKELKVNFNEIKKEVNE